MKLAAEKPLRRRSMLVLLALAQILALALPIRTVTGSDEPPGGPGESVPGTMRAVVSALERILASTGAGLPTPGSAADTTLLEGLADLTGLADELSEHLSRDDLAFMSSALAQQGSIARLAVRRRDGELFERVVMRTVDTCAACHERSPAPVRSRLRGTFDLAIDTDTDNANLARRARLAMATRQIARAARLLETALTRALDTDPVEFHARARDYLHLRIVLAPDLPAAATFFEGLGSQARASTDRAPMARAAEAVGASLRELGARESGPIDATMISERLEQAALGDPTALSNTGRALWWAARARERLQRPLRPGESGLSPEHRSALNWALGLAEHRQGESTWLPLSDLYLEKSILAAPGTGSAHKALGLLRRRIDATFSERSIPEDVEQHLTGLARLVQDSRRPGASTLSAPSPRN